MFLILPANGELSSFLGGEQNPSSSVQRPQVHERHVHVRNNFCIISQGQRWGTEPLQLCPETTGS